MVRPEVWTGHHFTSRLTVVAGGGDELSPVFEALVNEHRREIVLALAVQPRSIGQLADLRGLSLPAMTKHVKVLEAAMLVRRRKIGRTNILALRRDPLRLLQSWVGNLNPWWGTDDESLENYLEHLQPPSTQESP